MIVDLDVPEITNFKRKIGQKLRTPPRNETDFSKYRYNYNSRSSLVQELVFQIK